MKRKQILLLSLLSSSIVYGQIGVNTESPKSTFHVIPTKTDGSTAEGFIAPNLTRSQLISKDNKYTAAEEGTMVYITTLDGTVTSKTSKVTTVGYYYYDGKIWQQFATSAGGSIPSEPWRVQGTTTEATNNTDNIYQQGTVAIGSNTSNGYTFQVTGGSNITSNSRVGSSTVVGAQSVGSTLSVGGNTTIGKAAAGTTPASGDLLVMGRTSIGHTKIENDKSLYVKGITLLDGVTQVGTSLNNTSLTVQGSLEVKGGSFKLNGNGAGVGKYLVSDANGKGTWTTLPPYPTIPTTFKEPWLVQGSTTQATTNAQNIYQTGSVAIGTGSTAASAYKLDVAGTSNVSGNSRVGSSTVVGAQTIGATLAVTGNTTIGKAGVANTTPGTGDLRVHGTGVVGTSNVVYPNTNYTMHVFGRGAIGGLWVENYTNLKHKVFVGENLTAADDALIVSKGKTTLNGATTIAGTGSFTLQGNGVGAGKYLVSDAGGKGTWTTLPATATTEPWQVQGGATLATSNAQNIYQTGSVHIGANTAVATAYKLQVTGASNVTGNSRVGSSTVVGAQTVGTTLGVTGATTLNSTLAVAGASTLKGATTIGTTTAAANLVVNGNTGIGIASPTQKLDVRGNEFVSGISKVGGTTALNSSAQLELADNNKGFLPNRVVLTSSTVKAPVTNAVEGMLVYNTATVAAQGLKPGFYYWRGTNWQRLVDEIPPTSINLLDLSTEIKSKVVPGSAAEQVLAGTELLWSSSAGTNIRHITMPEDGSYAFSFRLYGAIDASTIQTIYYYLTLVKNGSETGTDGLVVDNAEMDITYIPPNGTSGTGNVNTYSITLSCKVLAGDKISVRLSHFQGTNRVWTLRARPGAGNAARTSMVWWKL
jgi:hypothetical protein